MANIEKQMSEAIEYILNHLEEDLKVKDIADYCHFSEFYFNRMFKTVVGESVYAFIKRRRIERSAFDLTTKTDHSITEIASQYGYSASNYSSAFKKHYDESPHDFKLTRGDKSPVPVRNYDYYNQRIRTEWLEPFSFLYERYVGPYSDMTHQWDDFIKRHACLRTEESLYVEISYDDPVITEENRCIYDLGMTAPAYMPDTLNVMTIPGGNYKVFRFEDTVDQLLSTFQGLFQVWFLQSNIDLQQGKIFQIYRSVDCGTHFMVIDIYIPC